MKKRRDQSAVRSRNLSPGDTTKGTANAKNEQNANKSGET